jgi:hypothetical protein
MHFFNENKNDDNKIQHLIIFQKPQKKNDEREKEKLSHFMSNKIQSNKTTLK